MEKSISDYIALNIRRLRLDRNWTQQLLAERAGVAAATIVHLESGRYWMRADMATRIARALEVDASELFKHPDSKFVQDPPIERSLEKVNEFVLAMGHLPGHVRKRLTNVRSESDIYVLNQFLEELQGAFKPERKTVEWEMVEAPPKKSKSDE